MDHAINTSEEKIKSVSNSQTRAARVILDTNIREKREIPLRRLDLMPMRISNDLCDSKRK